MSDETLARFEAVVDDAVRRVLAGGWRKRVMREELLGHLLSVYEEEVVRRGDARAAREAAERRFGGGEELARQLQASVPWGERVFCAWFCPKETVMSRPGWMFTGSAAAAVLAAIALGNTRYGPFVVVAMMVLSAAALVRWRPRVAWLVGLLAVPFGTSLVLPALAHIRDHGMAAPFAAAAAVGSAVSLAGLALFVHAVRARRAPVA